LSACTGFGAVCATSGAQSAPAMIALAIRFMEVPAV
jgi:hypothetical protein